MNIFFRTCPTCKKQVNKTRKEFGKSFCPHCKSEIIVIIKNKHILIILIAAMILPPLFFIFRYMYTEATPMDNFSIYINTYSIFIGIFIFVYISKNITWEKPNKL
jgi:DNA-directed RNA polymerase subunit RPC12/RpoP